MRAIMYHYVRRADTRYPRFRFLDVDNFKRQLDYFASVGGFLTQEEWYRFVESGEQPQNRDGHILTFDDAMACHYSFAFAELRARRLWGIFYVPSAPYTNAPRILDVHRVHLLCGAYDGSELLERAMGIVEPNMIPHEKRDEFRAKTYVRQINEKGVSEFKRLVNYFLEEEHRTEVLNRISAALGFSFSDQDFYVPLKGLREMSKHGMLLGSHTANHPVMSKLSYEEQQSEIRDSFDFISTLTNSTMKTYCHPYGGFHSFNTDTIAILEAEGVKFSFNVEPRDIEERDLANRQHLPRHDCNQFPHGAAS